MNDSTIPRAVIAGGSAGTGLAIAMRFASAGYEVEVCGRNADRLSEAIQRLRSCGVAARGWAVDVTDPQSLAEWLEQLNSGGRGLDAFIANAGDNPGDRDWKDAIGSNLAWIDNAVRGLHGALSTRRGAIVAVASIAASHPWVGEGATAYSVAKAALVRYGVALALELGSSGVRVNTVSPGPILGTGGFWDEAAIQEPAVFEAVRSKAPLGRLVSIDDIAAAVCFLAGPGAAAITGVDLRVDAGLGIRVDV